MNIQEIKNRADWNGWVCRVSSETPQKGTSAGITPFSQSWEWGEILRSEGKEVERLAAVEGDKPIMLAQVIYHRLPLGLKYAFCPKGPALANPSLNEKNTELFVSYFRKKKCVFFRVEPVENVMSYAFRDARKTIDINPRATLILDLSRSEEDLLNSMHAKTRYNIHLAEKKGVVADRTKNLDDFLNLSKLTGERDNFTLHAKKHYECVFASEMIHQLTAVSPLGDKIATAVFVGFGNTFTYLYGASDYLHRNFMAPHLLQWEGIKLGKTLGYRYYDFFGVAPKTSHSKENEYNYDPKHQYAGVTRFKLGFGGTLQEDPGTYDVVIDKTRFTMYQLMRKIRRLI